MIELVLVYCLAREPGRCEEKREVRQEVSNAIDCMLKSQTDAEQWVHAHPRYRLQGWRCEVDKPREEPA